MTLRVKTADGEVQFASNGEVWKAVRAGMVSIEDQVLLPGATEWRPVAELPGAPPPSPSLADSHWYILAAVLAALPLVFGLTWPTAMIALAVISAHQIWMQMNRRR